MNPWAIVNVDHIAAGFEILEAAENERRENEEMRETMRRVFCGVSHAAADMDNEFIHYWIDEKYLAIRSAIRAERIA